MEFKKPYKVPKLVTEITDAELITVWWAAFRRNDFPSESGIKCDVNAFRAALLKVINGN